MHHCAPRDGGGWVMRSDQARALPLPPLAATPYTLLLRGRRRPATSLRRTGRCRERGPHPALPSIAYTNIAPRPGKFRPGRVEMGESRKPPSSTCSALNSSPFPRPYGRFDSNDDSNGPDSRPIFLGLRRAPGVVDGGSTTPSAGRFLRGSSARYQPRSRPLAIISADANPVTLHGKMRATPRVNRSALSLFPTSCRLLTARLC